MSLLTVTSERLGKGPNEDYAEAYNMAGKELKKIKKENDNLKTLQKKLRVQLGDKDRRLGKLNMVAIESQNKCKQLEEQTEVLQKKLNEREKQYLALTDECEKLKAQIDEVEQNLKEKDEKIDTLSKNLNDVFKELQNQNENTKKILSDNEQHKLEVAELKEGNQELKSMCTSICEELKAMKSGRKSFLHNYSYRPVAQWRTGWKATPKQPETPKNRKK
ncbi:Hypothetical predicted protein [Mytilus galloprovincialis]|uniref:Uncharacterized protein n=1 Tax=Mytilus galloprovincialis TaxID=29158 RepID=A0A8B6G4J0_MYTGA|nr:Hypothetical predicted protein [Mytilus galloprovincialis]